VSFNKFGLLVKVKGKYIISILSFNAIVFLLNLGNVFVLINTLPALNSIIFLSPKQRGFTPFAHLKRRLNFYFIIYIYNI